MHIPNDFAAKLLDGLRAREREILGLVFFEQFSVPDVAHMVGIKVDSISGHLSKGLATVGRIIGDMDEARELLTNIGELLGRREPKQVFQVAHGQQRAVIGVLPHRQVMGGAVDCDSHLASHVTRYFIVEIDGKQVSAAEAERWYLASPMSLGLRVRRGLLAAKAIKSVEKFDQESSTFFLPAAFGCAELYYERDFDHAPLTLPLPPGSSVLDHLPPSPAQVDLRTKLVPHDWRLRVMDLGEHRPEYDELLAVDAEEASRSRPS
jgi:hypothetical protein